jgi:hypothetical protein
VANLSARDTERTTHWAGDFDGRFDPHEPSVEITHVSRKFLDRTGY